MKKLEDYVVSIPDYPEPGIIFRDVTSILQDAEGLQLAIDSLQKKLEGLDFDVIAERSPEDSSSECRSHTTFINRLYWSAKKENCLARQFLQSMHWNMALQRLRCTRTPLLLDRRLLSLMT